MCGEGGGGSTVRSDVLEESEDLDDRSPAPDTLPCLGTGGGGGDGEGGGEEKEEEEGEEDEEVEVATVAEGEVEGEARRGKDNHRHHQASARAHAAWFFCRTASRAVEVPVPACILQGSAVMRHCSVEGAGAFAEVQADRYMYTL